MAKKRFYAVARGEKTGVYTDSEDARKNTDNYPFARCKVFANIFMAAAYLHLYKDYPITVRKDSKKDVIREADRIRAQFSERELCNKLIIRPEEEEGIQVITVVPQSKEEDANAASKSNSKKKTAITESPQCIFKVGDIINGETVQKLKERYPDFENVTSQPKEYSGILKLRIPAKIGSEMGNTIAKTPTPESTSIKTETKPIKPLTIIPNWIIYSDGCYVQEVQARGYAAMLYYGTNDEPIVVSGNAQEGDKLLKVKW